MSSIDKVLGWFPSHSYGMDRIYLSGCAAVAADGGGHIGTRLEFGHSNLVQLGHGP